MPTISVIYEDDDLVFVHKPSGMPSVPHSPEEKGTAVEALLQRHGSQITGPEAGLLHRLDTGTSGILAFAKTEAEFNRVKALWKKREVRKFYRALCWEASGVPFSMPVCDKPPGIRIIDHPIGHSAKSSRRVIVLPADAPGKLRAIRGKPREAVTKILAIHQTPYPGIVDVRVEIVTGVLHQIRAHLAHEGLPIVGDPLYGPVEIRGKTAPLAERLWLHAETLVLRLKTGVELEVSSSKLAFE
jgi:23S rRNA pseudouridine1911/1915/1917 synthase